MPINHNTTIVSKFVINILYPYKGRATCFKRQLEQIAPMTFPYSCNSGRSINTGIINLVTCSFVNFLTIRESFEGLKNPSLLRTGVVGYGCS